MKKAAVLAACLSFLAFEASAISRYNSQGMTCGGVQSTVRSEGAVILRYKSKTSGMTLYDRYVAHGGYCSHNEVSRAAAVPSKDRSQCPVLKCFPRPDEDDWF